MCGANPYSTPRSALGKTEWVKVFLGEMEFKIGKPSSTDKILDHPLVLKELEGNRHIPYWAEIWPAARMLGKVLMNEPIPLGTRVLEIGCGLGLAGVVALHRGGRVTFSDYDGTALSYAAENALANEFTQFETLQLDWNAPLEFVPFPMILASDLIYEAGNVDPLTRLFAKYLAPGGVCLMTDQDRTPAELLKKSLTTVGLDYSTERVRAGVPGGDRYQGTLYRITWPG